MSVLDYDSSYDDQPNGAEAEAQRIAQTKARVLTIVSRLESEAADQISKKTQIEDRWVKDIRQFNGHYEPDVESALITEKKSRLFINETRAKTHAWEARLSDMLFPTDDDNWGIRPTPVPEMMGAEQLMKPGSDDAEKMKEINKIARARSTAMHAEIQDQLIEAQYNIKSRMVIHDGVQIGSGVMKGPIVENKVRRKYEKVNDQNDDGSPAVNDNGEPKMIWKLSEVADNQPSWEHVNPFNYFPDMSAGNANDAEFHYQRHLLNRKKMRKLAKRPGFDKDEIRQLLDGSPQEQVPDYLSKLRDITNTGQDNLDKKYHVWEYHGDIEAQELYDIATVMAGTDQGKALEDLPQPDSLEAQSVVIWFCEARLLKYSKALLTTGDSLYSVFNFEADPTNIFGFGVPYLLRDSQAAMNAAWRMTMDNAGLSVGPQIVINKELVEPVNGVWDLEPRKIWVRTKNLPYPTTAFEAFHIDSRQNELAQIIEMAKSFADDETNMPMIAQGDRGNGPRETAQGTSMLMNSANVVFRRVVKNYDDQMTTPNIRRSYDWNMAFNTKEHIKGDFQVDARGSSVLLVRELQAANLMTMLDKYSVHPELGPITKTAAMYRKTVQAHMLPANELVMTDSEIEIKRQEDSEKEQPPDPEMIKLEAQMNIAQIKAETDMQLAQIQQETAMMQLAEKKNMTVEQLAAKIQVSREQNQSSERKLQAEIVEARNNPDKPTGGSV